MSLQTSLKVIGNGSCIEVLNSRANLEYTCPITKPRDGIIRSDNSASTKNWELETFVSDAFN